MKNNKQKAGRLSWVARILCIIFAVFLSIFAMDVFSEGYGFWKTIPALLMHLIPTFLIIIVLLLSWRSEWIGAIIFSILGVAYIITGWGKIDWFSVVIISGPLFLLGILFFISWYMAKHRQA